MSEEICAKLLTVPECERIKKSYPDDDFMVHWLEYKGLRDAKEAYMAL